MATKREIEAGAQAMISDDPVVIGMLTPEEVRDLARACLTAAERVRGAGEDPRERWVERAPWTRS